MINFIDVKAIALNWKIYSDSESFAKERGSEKRKSCHTISTFDWNWFKVLQIEEVLIDKWNEITYWNA